MKQISFFMVIANLFMFWGEQPPLILTVSFLFALLSFVEPLIKKSWVTTFLTTSLVIIALIIIRINFQPFISAESVIAFILFLASIKLFELKTETDFFHLFLILNLVLAGLLILNPTFLMLVYALTQLAVSFYFVLRLNQGFLKQLNVKRMLMFFAPAIPMGFLFFFLFPRFTSGFNQTANLSQAESGYSDRIDLDLLRPMNLSSQSIFKVKFNPPQKIQSSDLYWRGTVLWETDGMHWTPSNYSLLNRYHAPFDHQGEELSYELFLEPGIRGPIFLLDNPISIDLDLQNYRQFYDHSYEFKHAMYFKNRMNAKSVLGQKDNYMSPIIRKKALRIKRYDAAEIKPFLVKIYGVKKLSLDEKIARLNQYFRNENFIYTLEPPAYKSVSDFLTSKKGYCSHFAAAYAFLARLGGIPSRVVSGFQGGEYNAFGEYYRIEAKDAHAWVEIYHEENGWTRVDPTEFVNPNRITFGARVLNEQMAPYYEWGGVKLEKKWFNFQSAEQLMKYIDYLNSNLSMFFYDFDHEYQRLLSAKFNLDRKYLGFYAALALIIFLVGSYMVMQYFNRAGKMDKALKDYLKLLKELENLGLSKEIYEGPLSFQLRVSEKFPEKKEFVERINRFIDARYGKN
ncbi:MAG: transglutaminaseTgpA domain-containing protein [Bacteriovoracaceae bacterium]